MKNVELSVRDEEQIIPSSLSGDTEKYHDLIRPYEHSVYRIALALMKNESDAEDVAQEAFLKAFRNLAAFLGRANFSTWLISITLNEARGRLRRQSLVRIESLDQTPEEGGHVSPALLRDWRGGSFEAPGRQESPGSLPGGDGGPSPH